MVEKTLEGVWVDQQYAFSDDIVEFRLVFPWQSL